MSSQRKVEANRRNGAKSRGPVTPEGKLRSAQARQIHGLASESAILTANEDPSALDQFTQNYLDYYQPDNPVDHHAVTKFAGLLWRIDRADSIEAALLDLDVTAVTPDLADRMEYVDLPTLHALAFIKGGADLDRLQRHQTSLVRRARELRNQLQPLRDRVLSAESHVEPTATTLHPTPTPTNDSATPHFNVEPNAAPPQPPSQPANSLLEPITPTQIEGTIL